MSILFAVILVAVVALIVSAWSRVAARTSSPNIRGDVLLVFAHPDDEAMFFSPLLATLYRMNVRFHFLCLSTGNAAGLGRVREKELHASGKYYHAASVTVLDSPSMRDGMKEEWDPIVVARAVRQAMDQCATIRTVITFDAGGVSGHPNHIATYQGVRHVQNTSPPGVLYVSLVTRGLLWKYISVFSMLPYFVGWSRPERDARRFTCVVFPEMALQSFWGMRCHASQFVWFRYVFVVLSSYTVHNDFTLLR